MPEIAIGNVISFRGGIYAVIRLSNFGIRFKLMPVTYEGRGQWYLRVGDPTWIRKSALKDAEVLDDFCQITI